MYIIRYNLIIIQTMKITKKETRVSVRITPEQENMLDLICNELDIKRSILVRFAIDQLIKNYSDL